MCTSVMKSAECYQEGKTVSFMNAEGKRVTWQKRLLLCNLKEAYQHFKSVHPDAKVGFSTFASLRPKECVLAGVGHTQCMCAHYIRTQNWCLLEVSFLLLSSEQQFLHSQQKVLGQDSCQELAQDLFRTSPRLAQGLAQDAKIMPANFWSWSCQDLAQDLNQDDPRYDGNILSQYDIICGTSQISNDIHVLLITWK